MLMKKLTAILATTLAVMLLLVQVSASGGAPAREALAANAPLPTFDVPCKNAVLMCGDTGEILYEKDADKQVSVASITKVMTLLLTFEAIDSGKIAMTDKVPVSAHAYGMGGSQIWLEPGEEFTLDEMIKAICVSSANDAAVAVAEYVGGSEPVFAEMMNQKAQQLGMTNSHFLNACGLDAAGHYSSARDVAIMTRALMEHKTVFNYTGIWMDTLRGGATQLVNTNRLIKSYAGITGMKTGTTGLAGRCISATAEREGMGLVAVVLGSVTSDERFSAAMELLDYGFANYEAPNFPEIPNATAALPIRLGEQKEVKLLYKTPKKILVKKGEGTKLSVQLSLPEKLSAPIEKNIEIGSVKVQIGEETVAQYPIVTALAVAKMEFSSALGMLFDALVTL
ncbi:MAG: D-alanyl-D-alanine carboxypeptidase family protein [Oscillospiraceae bacterium]